MREPQSAADPKTTAGQTLRGRWALGVALVIALFALLGAGQALADSASISVTTTGGQSDPVAKVPRIFSISGVASIPEHVYVKSRAPGGAPCAPTAISDSGSTFEGGYFSWGWDENVNGTFNLQRVLTWSSPGTEVFCIWLAASQEAITTPITQTITFRAPTGTITATVNPITPQPGQQATVTISGASESPERVYAAIRPAGGAPCAPTFEADTGHNLVNGESVNGSFSTQATTIQQTAGTYLICLWLASSATDTHPVAGPQPETFTVAAPPPPPPPPPPCVVPSFGSNAHLATIEHRIQAGHCSVGRVRYLYSLRVRKNAVLRLAPGPRARLPFGARIEVFVSSGPRSRRHRHRRR